jgi:DNA-binding XRE family transcriptional regulator
VIKIKDFILQATYAPPAKISRHQTASGWLPGSDLRQALSLTQKQFTAHLGVTFPTINRWENGHAMPSPLALKQLALLLNQLCESPDVALRERSKAIQAKYCLLEEPKA